VLIDAYAKSGHLETGSKVFRSMWLELKYRQNGSVLRRMSCVSKGPRRVYMNVEGIAKVFGWTVSGFCEWLED